MEARNSSDSSSLFISSLFGPLAAHENSIVSLGLVDPTNSSTAHFVVFKEEGGEFVQVAFVPTDGASYTIFNNGKWMGGLMGGYVSLFQLDADNNLVNQTKVTVDSEVVYLLDDSTIVYIKGNSNFSSLVFNPEDSTWSESHSFSAPNIYLAGFPWIPYWVGDDHIIFLNTTGWTFIYTRQSDGSWSETDGFAFNLTLTQDGPFNLYFNGADTVVFAAVSVQYPGANAIGFLAFITKIGNEWTMQIITADDLSLTGTSLLGFGSFAVIDQNNLVFGAPYEGLDISPVKRGASVLPRPAGKAAVIRRQNNVWTPIVVISTPNVGLLAGALAVTNNYIVRFGSVQLKFRNTSF